MASTFFYLMQPYVHHTLFQTGTSPPGMQDTPTQRLYQATVIPPSNGGMTPRPRQGVTFAPQGRQVDANHSINLPVPVTRAFPNMPLPVTAHRREPGPSITQLSTSQKMPPTINNGPIQGMGKTTQDATPDSESDSDSSQGELWSPESKLSSAISTVATGSTIIAECDDDTDSEDEDDVVLNSTVHRQVRDGMCIFHRHGHHALIEVLINFGTSVYESARPTATAARLILKCLRLQNERQARDLKNFLRFEAVRLFRDYWMPEGEWKIDKARNLERPYLTLKGVNLAGLLGSLFHVNILTGDDVHLCLNHLVANTASFHPLCAIHALIVHCGKKICKRSLLPGTHRFCTLISIMSPQTRRYIWAYDKESFDLLMDVFGTIDRWLATQTLKQIRAASDPVKIAAKMMKKKLPTGKF